MNDKLKHSIIRIIQFDFTKIDGGVVGYESSIVYAIVRVEKYSEDVQR